MDTTVPQISVSELKQRLDNGDDLILLDVREPHEYRIVNLGGVLIPLHLLPIKHNELDRSKEIVVYCHHGMRSLHAVQFLRRAGFTNVKNLSGGIHRWACEIDPKAPRY